MNKNLIIVAPPYGMGAIIKLTCVGIWLARELNKVPIVWWGTSCLYSQTDRINYYSQFFKQPLGSHCVPYELIHKGTFYPAYWKTVQVSLKTIDDLIPPNDHYTRLDWKCTDSAQIKTSDICVLHSALTTREAWNISGKADSDFNEDEFDQDLGAIFREYFSPSRLLKNDFFPKMRA